MSAYSIRDFLEAKASFAPAFNPDASRVVFLNNDTGTAQLYAMPRQGGPRVQLTDFPDSVSGFAHSPAEERVVFSKSEGGDENAQLYLLDVETKSVSLLVGKKGARHGIGSFSRDGKRLSYSSNARNGKDFDVYVIDLSTLESALVWSPGGMCAAGPFSPTGRYLAMSLVHSNEDDDLYLYDLEKGEAAHLSPHEEKATHGMPRWLPDESAFFFVTDQGEEFSGLARYSMKDGRFGFVMRPRWDVSGAGISRQGNLLSVFVNEDGYRKVSLYDPKDLSAPPRKLPFDEAYGVSFSQDERYAVCTVSGSRFTSDIWVVDMRTLAAARLTESFQKVPSGELVEPSLIRYRSFDGLEVPAFVYRPKGADASRKLPVIVHIHGGPESQYVPSFAPLIQYLVYAGYAVVAPNVRGSSGYGKTYMALDNVEKRMDSVKDVVALREHLASLSYVDAERIVVMGGSYGGFMTLACLAFYPGLFAAGVDIVGIANFVTFLEKTAPYRRRLREAEYGSLEKDRRFLESISPINAADRIVAPLFMIHGANDPRVPLYEAEQVYSKLKALGRRVELLVYPDEGHGLSKLKNRLDAYPKAVDFLKEVLGL